MEITVNIADTLFDSIPKGTVVANYVTEVDTVNFKMYSTVYSIDETNKAIVTTKKIDANNLEAIHFDAINWVTTDKATIDNIYPRVVSKYQNKFKKEGVIYKITKDYDLNGCVLTIPDNCTLQFEGGTITNGSINLNYCNIDSTRNSIINNCILKGYLNKQTVYSDWFYLDSDDCTDTLSNIFKISKGCKLILNEGTYNVSVKNLVGSDYADPINISILQPQSNSHIIINGTINLISTNRTHYNIIGIVDKDNVTIEGIGEIIGDLQTHTGTTGEWGHGILVSGSRNVNVRDLKVSYCWGDGLSVSYAEKILTDSGLIDSSYTPPKSINITNIKSSFNRRLGISIINGDGIILENSVTEGNGTINGTSPKAGLDIEPNPNQSVNNVIVNGCLFYDNVVTYFPSDGLIEDKAISCIIQNSICKRQVTVGNVGKIIGCEIKYLLINGSRFVNVQDNVITESLILAGTVIDGLNVVGNTFLGLTTDGYDSCIRVSCNSFSKVNIANNNFSLYTNSNMRKLVTYTKKQTNAIDIIDSVINYNKNLTLLFYPYANFYNCKFTFSGFNIYNITSELDKYPDSCSFVNCSFIANNSSFYIRDNIVDNYKIIIENCKYYTKQDNPTDFINFIGHTSSLNIISLNNTGKSILYLNDVDEENNRPVINNNYNGHRFYNTSKHRPEYYFNNNWFDSCGYNVNENRNSDGTLIDKLSIISDKSKILNSNKIYKIVSDIDLQGETLTIPANCTLDFQGGSFSNGTLIGSNTKIEAGLNKIFDTNIILNGSWNVNEAYPEWFGEKTSTSIQLCLDYFPVVKLGNSTYTCSTSVVISNSAKVLKGEQNNTVLDFSTCSEEICINVSAFRAVLQNVVIKTDNFVENQIGVSFTYSTENGQIENVIVQGFYNGININKTWYSVLNNIRIRNVSPQGYGMVIGSLAGTSKEEINNISFNNIWIEGGKNSIVFNNIALGAVVFDTCTFESTQETALKTLSQVSGAVSFKNCYFEKNYLSTNRTVESIVLWYKGTNDIQAYFDGGLYRDQSAIKSYIVDNASFISPMYVANAMNFGTDRVIDYTPNGINATKFNKRRYYNESFLQTSFNSLDEQTISLRPIYSSFELSTGEKKKFATIVLSQDVYYSAYIKVDLIVRAKRPNSTIQGMVSYIIYIDKYSSTASDQGMWITQADEFIQKKFSNSNLDLRESILLKGKVLPYNASFDTSPFILYIDAIDGADYIINARIQGYRTDIGTNSNNFIIKEDAILTSDELAATDARVYNKIGITNNRPLGIEKGFEYYDTTLSKYICWNGTTWTNLDGSTLT